MAAELEIFKSRGRMDDEPQKSDFRTHTCLMPVLVGSGRVRLLVRSDICTRRIR
jgi:hypothetical protein